SVHGAVDCGHADRVTSAGRKCAISQCRATRFPSTRSSRTGYGTIAVSASQGTYARSRRRALRQSHQLACLVRRRRLHVEIADDAHDPLDQLDIVGEAAARVIEVVL